MARTRGVGLFRLLSARTCMSRKECLLVRVWPWHARAATSRSLSTGISIPARRQRQYGGLRLLRSMLRIASLRASADNNKQQCCWSSMCIGSSDGTAVKSAATVAAPLGLAVLARCGHRSFASAACCVALRYGTRYQVSSGYYHWYIYDLGIK